MNEKQKTEFLLKEDDDSKWYVLSNKPFGEWTISQKRKVEKMLDILNNGGKQHGKEKNTKN